MIYDKPITIQKIDSVTEKWKDVWRLHARVNKTSGGQNTVSGATRPISALTFDVRYFKGLEDLRLNNELYRLIYGENAYNIVDYDDYMESHISVSLDGEFVCRISQEN